MAAADGPRAPDHVEIVAHPLVHDDVVKRVADDGAGAIVTFIGTTRDTFEYRGEVRNVEKLEYECFTAEVVVHNCKKARIPMDRWRLWVIICKLARSVMAP